MNQPEVSMMDRDIHLNKDDAKDVSKTWSLESLGGVQSTAQDIKNLARDSCVYYLS